MKQNSVKRSRFLRFKDIMDAAEKHRKWYEPTPAERLKAYYENTDWSKVDSNLEKLPYLAYQLKCHTPKKKPRKNKPEDLYTFAVPGWKKTLDPAILSAIPEEILERQNHTGTCRYRIAEVFRL